MTSKRSHKEHFVDSGAPCGQKWHEQRRFLSR